MPFIQFPVIPSLDDDPVMAVSAATIDKGHNSGVRYILGESHASMPAATEHNEHRDEDSYYKIAEIYVYHTSLIVRYGFQIKTAVATKNYHVRIRATDKDDTLRTMCEATDVNDGNYVWLSADIDIASTPDGDLTTNFPLSKIYKWQFEIRCDAGESDYVWIIVWGLFCRKVVAGGSWVAPHEFAEDETSAASHFNGLRTDINLLRDQLSPIVPFSLGAPNARSLYDDDNDNAFVAGAYRYRPESVYGVIKVEFESAGSNFRLYMKITDTAENAAKFYESGNTASTGHDQVVDAEVDLTAGTAATAISNAGITLTFGNYYLIEVGIDRQDGGVVYEMEFGAVARASSGTPHEHWEPLNEWAEGDTDFGPSHLNDIRLNLLQFYTGGVDVMWGESPGVLSWYPGISGHEYSTVHRKRWLVYHVYSGTDPIKIWYGDDYDDSYELPVTSGWLNFDLTELPIPWGSYYHVIGNCDGVFECDSAYEA